MYKIITILVIVVLILLIGNIFITSEGFTTAVGDTECSFDEDQDDENCNRIDAPGINSSFFVNNVCPKDPRCLGICINDHTWTDANKRQINYRNAISGRLKNPEFSHLLSSSRCSECIKNFIPIIRLIHEQQQCNI